MAFSTVVTVIDTRIESYFLIFLRMSTVSLAGTEILKGFVTCAGSSAPNATLQAARAALSQYAATSVEVLDMIASALKTFIEEKQPDRILIPSMEVLGYLFSTGALDKLEGERWSRYKRASFLSSQ